MKIKIIFSDYYTFSVVLFCSYRGIQGKKCGTIIVKAEELNNCRVSVSSIIKICCWHIVNLIVNHSTSGIVSLLQ